MTNPLPDDDSERAIPPYPANKAAFLAACERRGFEPNQKNFDFWQDSRAAAKVGANVAADIPTWQEREKAFRARVEDGGPVRITYMKEEIAALRAAIVAGAPAEKPELTERQINEVMDMFGKTGLDYPSRAKLHDFARAIQAKLYAAQPPQPAQPAPAPATDELHFNAQRRRNVAHLAGLEGAIPEDDASLDGARGAVLGQIAARLRAAKDPQ